MGKWEVCITDEKGQREILIVYAKTELLAMMKGLKKYSFESDEWTFGRLARFFTDLYEMDLHTHPDDDKFLAVCEEWGLDID